MSLAASAWPFNRPGIGDARQNPTPRFPTRSPAGPESPVHRSYALGSVVELNQAELSAEAAQIGDASALYEYQSQLAVLTRNLGRLPPP